MQNQKYMNKGLYEHTNSRRKLLRSANMSAVDRGYRERTIYSTEARLSRKRRQPQRPGVGDAQGEVKWTCGRTLSELNTLDPDLKNKLDSAVLSGVEVLDDTFRETIAEHYATAPVRKEAATTDSGAKAPKKKYVDENLYIRRIRAEKNDYDLSEWRQQMKSLEDSKAQRVIYDRIGRGEKTLLQER